MIPLMEQLTQQPVQHWERLPVQLAALVFVILLFCVV